MEKGRGEYQRHTRTWSGLRVEKACKNKSTCMSRACGIGDEGEEFEERECEEGKQRGGGELQRESDLRVGKVNKN